MMARYRNALPQLSRPSVFLTDGGLETDLIFNEGFELPLFASFPLFETAEGKEAMRNYYLRFAEIARTAGTGFILEAGTWRANRDWANQLGYTSASLANVIRRSIDMLVDIRQELADRIETVVISAAIGPRADAYDPKEIMTPEEAEAYHSEQVETVAATEADFVTALTLGYVAEAVGIVRAAQSAKIPAVISFTVETDGSLVDGSSLRSAILEVDDATDQGAAYFGINCAHPTHFAGVLDPSDAWTNRIRMIRPNASRMSHAELDEAEVLDDGDPAEFGRECADIRRAFPQINVLGGCCGTDVRHVGEVAGRC
jgi:homocysteine S-methyltransferase